MLAVGQVLVSRFGHAHLHLQINTEPNNAKSTSPLFVLYRAWCKPVGP